MMRAAHLRAFVPLCEIHWRSVWPTVYSRQSDVFAASADEAWVGSNFHSRRGAETQRSLGDVPLVTVIPHDPVRHFFLSLFVILNLFQDNMRRLFVILKRVQHDGGWDDGGWATVLSG